MPAFGILQVRVFTSIAELPLAGATVIVARPTDSGKYALVSVQQTDSSGMIHPVPLSTPAIAQSCSPSAGDAPPPFALCDVWAEMSGYAMQSAHDIQIFPGVDTLQEFRLPPLEQGQTDLSQRTSHTTPAHDL